MRPLSLAFLLVFFLAASTTSAQVVNGDFDDGLTGWTASVPNVNWITEVSTATPTDGPYARVISPFFGDGGVGCLAQTFECGEAGGGTCNVSLFYRLDLFDAGPNTGVVRVSANGVEQFVSPTTEFEIDWTEINFSVPCGTIELDLCLDADAGNHAWIAGFDAVTGTCDGIVDNDAHSWSAIKALF